MSEGITPLDREPDGYFSGLVAGLRPGARYRFRLDDDGDFPDPASRFQPEGPHGPSEVVDPGAFTWTDRAWRGPDVERSVIYELHVGLYTREGTYRALIPELEALAALGVTCLELMPLAEFPGEFGWGYDGVDLFAPSHLYGRPDDLRALIDAAHARGLAVILDVVYNHLGPDGNYLGAYSPSYFTKKYSNEWGDPLNFDGEESRPARELFVTNARYWIDELHFDGLRLDATQSMFDESSPHILRELSSAVRSAAGERRTLLVAENEPQDTALIHVHGVDLLWNDDFHHSARVAATGCRDAYFMDYRGTPQELLSTVKHGFLFQGQTYRWQKKRRGTSTRGLARFRTVGFVQNHDQVANSASGARLHQLTSPSRFRAVTALNLLAPSTPMLFMGQEFAASAPFLYFADLPTELAVAVRRGRRQFLTQFATIATDEIRETLSDPGAKETFERCKLDLGERETHRETVALHTDLLRLRPRVVRGSIDGAVLAEQAFCVRYAGAPGESVDHLLLCNLGRQTHLPEIAEPLLAPLAGSTWRVIWSSESRAYGGRGTPPIEREDGSFELQPESVVVLSCGSASP